MENMTVKQVRKYLQIKKTIIIPISVVEQRVRRLLEQAEKPLMPLYLRRQKSFRSLMLKPIEFAKKYHFILNY